MIFTIKAEGFHNICATSIAILSIDNFAKVVIGINLYHRLTVVSRISNFRSVVNLQSSCDYFSDNLLDRL